MARQLSRIMGVTIIVLFTMCLCSSAVGQTSNNWVYQIVGNSTGIGEFSSLDLDSHNIPYISYHDETNSQLMCAKLVNSKWEFQIVDCNSGSNVGLFTSLVVDSNDNPHISYTSNTLGSDGLYYGILKYASWTGSTWSIQTVDPNIENRGAIGITSLKINSAGYPCISYISENRFLKYAQYTGSSWNIQTVDSTSNGHITPVGNSLALDSSDNPHISYYDSINSNLKYASLIGSTWDLRTVDSNGEVGKYCSLALDPANNPHISYEDYTNRQLKYVSWTGSTWNFQIVDPKSDVNPQSSIAIDHNGNPCISYHKTIAVQNGGYQSVETVENGDLMYAQKEGSDWVIQTVISQGEVGTYNSLALDSNYNPQISCYAAGSKVLVYATIATSEVTASVNPITTSTSPDPSTPLVTPSVPEFQSWIILLPLVLMGLFSLLTYKRLGARN
jgi:hypothetical protein